jgi:hypothetical protein
MTALEKMKAFEAEYLQASGWICHSEFEPTVLWYKPGDPRTNGTPVPQLTAVIWQRLDDEHGPPPSPHLPG